jgi:hypothetical protein
MEKDSTMQMSIYEPPRVEAEPRPVHETCNSTKNAENIHDNCRESSSSVSDNCAEGESTDGESPQIEMLGKLPPEIGMLLILSGIAGILLPGPVGTPLLIAGGVTLWPKTFQPIERWFSRRCPQAHREGVLQIKEFVANLQNRFPEQK